MSLLSGQFGKQASAGVGKVSAIFLLVALVGGLIGHVVARVALSICCLMHAFWTGIVGVGLTGARRFESSGSWTAGPASQPQLKIRVCLPNA